MRCRVIVHGGVDSTGGREELRALEEAAEVGHDVVFKGGDAVSAVEAAIRLLEDKPLFNAGLGSVLNQEGEVETDASIVDGSTGRFAGVAALTTAAHPISVAVDLLRRAPGPVLLAGEGARRFAARTGAEERDLRTPEQVRVWERARAGLLESVSLFTGRLPATSDTVGAIVVDQQARVAAGSSTGGILLKMPGRVGDAAILGAGIYADGSHAALCSGSGEAAIELSLAHRAMNRYQLLGDLEQAGAWAVGLLEDREAVGGIVVYDAERNAVAVAHNAASFLVVSESGRGPNVERPVRLNGGHRG